jgi:hypothetical protein
MTAPWNQASEAPARCSSIERPSARTDGLSIRLLDPWAHHVFCFDQTHVLIIRYRSQGTGVVAMFTSAECRAHAEEKLAQAEREPRNRKRLTTAAEGWLFLAGQMTRLENAPGGKDRKRSKIRADQAG